MIEYEEDEPKKKEEPEDDASEKEEDSEDGMEKVCCAIEKLTEVISSQKPPEIKAPNVKLVLPPAKRNRWRFEIERDKYGNTIKAIIATPMD